MMLTFHRFLLCQTGRASRGSTLGILWTVVVQCPWCSGNTFYARVKRNGITAKSFGQSPQAPNTRPRAARKRFEMVQTSAGNKTDRPQKENTKLSPYQGDKSLIYFLYFPHNTL